MADRLAFEISPELRERVEATIEAVRGDPGDRAGVGDLISTIQELTETGLEYYFLLPLELAEVGGVSRSTARVGVAAARQGMPHVIRRVVGSMSEQELLAIVDFLDGMLIRNDD